MIRIAITGNIASGKSAVQNILEKSGYNVLDTDKTAHMLLNELEAVRKVFRAFDVFEPDGSISREKLGRLVFDRSDLKKKLEEIIHPAVKEKILEFFETNKSEKFVFVSIPLLFECGMRNLFEKALLIYTEDSIREKRLISRNHYSLEYANKRMSAQMPQDEKKELCDYVIYNNGTLKELEDAVNAFLITLS